MTYLPPPALVQAVAGAGLPVTGAWQWQTGGQTNRLWHLVDHALVVKLYQGTDNPLFANDPVAEAACLTRLGPAGIAPHLVAQGDCALGVWLAYGHVAGRMWRSDPVPVAHLLRRLHGQQAVDLPRAPDGAGALRQRGRAILQRLPDMVARHLDGLEPPDPPDHPAARLALLHGDPVPGNIVVQGSTARLIDWQCPAFGDPAQDLALFLSPGMQQVYRGAPLTASEQAITLAAYGCPRTTARLLALRPLYHWVMAAYCHWKVTQGALAYARAAQLEEAAL